MAKDKLERKLSYTYGTDGIWTYRKYDDHRYHAWYEGGVNFKSGTAWIGGYWHETKSGLTPPSFSTAVTGLVAAPNSDMLMAFVGHNPSTLSTYWLDGISTEESNRLVRLDMYGTW